MTTRQSHQLHPIGAAVDRRPEPKATASAGSSCPADATWQERLEPFAEPDDRAAWGQILTSAPPFAAGWMLMSYAWEIHYLWVLLVAFPVSGFYLRLFLIQHDCGHGSFFTSRRANHVLGHALSLLSLTPFHYWRRTHGYHHAVHGDLDRRAFGDLHTLTVEEYLALGFKDRVAYRATRSLFVLMLFGPIFQILLKHRYPWDMPRSWKKEWRSVWGTNLGLAGLLAVGIGVMGAAKLFALAAPIFLISWAAAMWVLYVQHHFEHNYWVPHDTWSFEDAALEGTTFYDLPAVLHFFTADIGYHHIHHLSPRIPNYKLRACFDTFPELQDVKRLTLRQSLSCARCKLWDGSRRRMVGFDELPSAADVGR